MGREDSDGIWCGERWGKSFIDEIYEASVAECIPMDEYQHVIITPRATLASFSPLRTPRRHYTYGHTSLSQLISPSPTHPPHTTSLLSPPNLPHPLPL